MDQTAEVRTVEWGRALFAGMRRHAPAAFSRAWFMQQALHGPLSDAQVNAQMFRFIDVLPSLRNAGQIVDHLHEYLQPVAARLPFALRLALPLLRHKGPVGALIAACARGLSRSLARSFIAGGNEPEVLRTITTLRQARMAFTIDVLGEAVVSDEEALSYQRTYLGLIEHLAGAARHWPEIAQIDRDDHQRLPQVNLSLKLSALVARFDVHDWSGTSSAVAKRLRPILRKARQTGVFVNVDMEQHAYKDLTLAIFKQVLEEPEFRAWRDVGIAMQAYLRQSGNDLRELADWARARRTPVWVRLVKGAYHDYERVMAAQLGWPLPVFKDKSATDAHFEVMTRLLLERHDHLRPAIASHNVRSIAHALALAERFGLPPRFIEFQALYGMADHLKAALVDHGQRVRVYTPFGHLLPGMAYLVRRLLENTSNQSFVRVGAVAYRNEKELLMPPLPPPPELPVPTGDPARAAGMPSRPAAAVRMFENEPPSDFSSASARGALTAKLVALHRRLAGSPITCPLVIDGVTRTGTSSLLSRNPSRPQEIVAKAASASVADAQDAIEAAGRAFARWSSTSVAQRAQLLERAADILRRQRFELCALIICEAGKGMIDADYEVAEAIDFCRYYAAVMRQLASGGRCDLPGEENRLVYQARGVAVVIAPWNFPLAILCGMTAAALVCGNTVVMKPAEQTPGVAAALFDVFAEAGLPPGVLNYLPGIGEVVGGTLVTHARTALIAFTGSLAVGQLINRQAAEVTSGAQQFRRVICEMGGKNAIIVDADADLDEAVVGVLHSAFGYQGQKCSACSRVIVVAEVVEAFTSRLVAAASSLQCGDAEDPATAIGPVIDEQTHARLTSRIAQAQSEGRLVFAGTQPKAPADGAQPGWMIPAHIFADVSPHSSLAQDEIFGPVLSILPAADFSQAITIANGTRYALTGGVYSRSPSHLEEARRCFQVGNLYLNRRITGALVERQPFGGLRLSGVGSKAGGSDYLLQFLQQTCITENTLRHGFAPELVSGATVGGAPM